MVSQTPGSSGKPHNPVVPVGQVEFKLVNLALFGLYAVLGLLFLCLLVIFGEQFLNIVLLLVAGEFVERLAVEEHYVNVSFRAPAAVAAVAGLVGGPCHGLAAEGPAEAAVGVAASGQVGDFTAVYINQGHIGVVPAAVCLIIAQQIVAVGTPGEAQVAVAVGVESIGEHSLLLAGLQVAHHQFAPVLYVCQMLAVRRDCRVGAGDSGRRNQLLGKIESIGKVLVFLRVKAGLPYPPVTVALGGVIKLAAVGREAHAPFASGGTGYAAGGLVIDGCHENIAPGLNCNLFSVRGNCDVGGAGGYRTAYLVLDELVLAHADLEFRGFGPFAAGIEVSVV